MRLNRERMKRSIEQAILASGNSPALQNAFARYLMTGDGTELRDVQAGNGVVTNTAGTAGGYFVPETFWNQISISMADTDSLLDPDDVTVLYEKGFSARPKQLTSWDLSTISSTKISENTQQTGGAFPTAANTQIQANMHRLTLAASYEFDQDNFFGSTELMTRAYGVGFARGIGKEVAQTLLSSAVNSGINIADVPSVSIQIEQLSSVYFALDRAYRTSPKCRWAMNDKTYEKFRNMKTTTAGPLLDVTHDDELLMGKPILICPSIPGLLVDSGVANGKILFGDFSHLIVRMSQMVVRVDKETAADKGQTMYHGRLRTDSKVLDASAGSAPPIIYATITA